MRVNIGVRISASEKWKMQREGEEKVGKAGIFLFFVISSEVRSFAKFRSGFFFIFILFCLSVSWVSLEVRKLLLCFSQLIARHS